MPFISVFVAILGTTVLLGCFSQAKGQTFGQNLLASQTSLTKISDVKFDYSQLPNADPQPQILVTEVVVTGVDDPVLNAKISEAIATQAGQIITRSQLQQDIMAIFAIGLFKDVRAQVNNQPPGVKVTFEVELNPPLQAVVVEGSNALPPDVIEAIFEQQYGQTLDFQQIEVGIEQLNTWYQENGYRFAEVSQTPEISPDGFVILNVSEGVIEDIQIRFLDPTGATTDVEGNPIVGKTQDFVILRELELEPGKAFNERMLERDLNRLLRLGIFQDVRLQLEPGLQDPRQVRMIINVLEQPSTSSLGLVGGFDSIAGLFGGVNYQAINLGGNNQKLAANVQWGQRSLLLDVGFTDPWIVGDPHRTSYRVNAFRRRDISAIFDEGEEDVRLPNGDRPRLTQTGLRLELTRPLAESPHVRPNWVGSVGLQYQRVQVTDADGDITPRDQADQLLSASESGEDDIFAFRLGLRRDRRNRPFFPTSGSLLRIGTEQAIPIGSETLSYNRLQASYTHYLPLNVSEASQTLVIHLEGGTLINDFPPYQAFTLGGSNSVRGWSEASLAVGRSFVFGSLEYRFPLRLRIPFPTIGAIFLDAGSALGTQNSVPGEPGEVRDKPGSGLGFGVGLRVQSPFGPIRIDYGISNQGDSQIHFGLGERL